MPSEMNRTRRLRDQTPGCFFGGFGNCRLFAQMALAVLVACGLSGKGPQVAKAGTPPLKIIAFGDSLTAGAGLRAGEAFPAVLEEVLRKEGYNVTIVNAGVSGETAPGGLTRLEWTIGDGASGAILELGANDMLRGMNPEVTKAALDEILARFSARGIKVLIAGMKATPSHGPDYKTRFDAIYPELARKYDVPLYPFFLDGVAGVPELNQKDGLHPSSAGVARIVKGIMPMVRTMLNQMGAKAVGSQ
jgi:acyl-CoA thioesterase I